MPSVLFDMDGVVIDSQPVASRMMRETAARLGIPMSEEDFAAWAGLSGNQFWTLMRSRHNLPEPIEFYRAAYDVAEEIRRYADLAPVEGAVELMDALAAAGVRLALATSGSARRMNAVLDLFGMQDRFAAKVCADDVAVSKPEPEIFLTAARRLGAPPARCVVIEDSTHGLEAARRAGMRTIGFTGCLTPGHDLSAADLVIDSLRKLDVATVRKLIE